MNNQKEVFENYRKNYKLKTLELNINYRDDYNGRPSAYLVSSYLLVKTHPFYIWGERKNGHYYGRAYTYDVFTESEVGKVAQPTPILKATVTDQLDIFHELYRCSADFNTLLEKLGEKKNFTFRDVNFVKSEKAEFAETYKLMCKGRLPDPTHGCLSYQNNYWVLTITKKTDYSDVEDESTALPLIDEYFHSLNSIHVKPDYDNEVMACYPHVKHTIGKVFSSGGCDITIAYLQPIQN